MQISNLKTVIPVPQKLEESPTLSEGDGMFESLLSSLLPDQESLETESFDDDEMIQSQLMMGTLVLNVEASPVNLPMPEIGSSDLVLLEMKQEIGSSNLSLLETPRVVLMQQFSFQEEPIYEDSSLVNEELKQEGTEQLPKENVEVKTLDLKEDIVFENKDSEKKLNLQQLPEFKNINELEVVEAEVMNKELVSLFETVDTTLESEAMKSVSDSIQKVDKIPLPDSFHSIIGMAPDLNRLSPVTDLGVDVKHSIRWDNQVEVMSQIEHQIKLLKENDSTTLTLKLYPKNLGNISVEMQLKNGILNAQVLLEQPDLKPVIEQAIQHIQLDGFETVQVNVEVGANSQSFFKQQEEKSANKNTRYFLEEEDESTQSEFVETCYRGQLNLKV